jgi:16S rRNA (guanine527-N7)-methyltransferase
MESTELLKAGLKEYGIRYDNEMLAKFDKYTDLILAWNKRMNLTAIKERTQIAVKHHLDSLSIFDEIAKYPDFIDIGTGAGFPGIPLCIAGYKGRTVLVDSLKKRVDFLKVAITELGLENCTAIQARAEDIAKGEMRDSFSSAAARAVAPLPVLLEYCLPVLKKGGMFIAMKGPGAAEEAIAAKKALRILGGEIEITSSFPLIHTDMRRTLIYIRKIKDTPGGYPRKAGTPSKKPL